MTEGLQPSGQIMAELVRKLTSAPPPAPRALAPFAFQPRFKLPLETRARPGIEERR